MAGAFLDYLAGQLGCYISALKTAEYSDSLRGVFRSFSFERYTLEECAYSLSYIFDEDCRFEDYTQLKQYLSRKTGEK